SAAGDTGPDALPRPRDGEPADPAQRPRDPLPPRRRVEGRRGREGVRGQAEPGHTREPRAVEGRPNRCNPGSRCCSQASRLTEASLYVEVRRGRAPDLDTRQTGATESPRPPPPPPCPGE